MKIKIFLLKKSNLEWLDFWLFWKENIKALKVNQEITTSSLLLIDEAGQIQGEVSLDQAKLLAYEKGFDLVLINENNRPPIAKLMDYGKYLYSQEKQVSKQRASSHGSELKEIRFGIKIGEHDLAVKITKIKKFLEHGDKVKITVILRGREMMFRDRVNVLMNKIKTETNANFEKNLEKMGNRFFVILVRK